MDIIAFIRQEKNTPVDDVIDKMLKFEGIETSSRTMIFYDVFKQNFASLNFRRFVEFVKFINKKLNELPPTTTIENVMTKIRTAVREHYSYSEFYQASLNHLVFNREAKKDMIEKYNEKVEHDLKNSEEIKISFVNKIFRENKNGNNYREILTYLLINSGCRYIELSRSIIEPSRENGYITIKNIAKTKDKERVVSKPLLDKNVDLFMSKLLIFRSLPYTAKALLVGLNKYLKYTYAITSYNLRKTYANVSYHLFAKKTVQKQSWIGEILGHDSVDVAKIYSPFYITEDEQPNF